MEEQNGAPTDGVVATPFSELISAWLDEGDRLDEKAAATAPGPATSETPLRRLAARLRPALDRHRLFVLAGAGLIPFLLFTLTHHSSPEATVALAAAAVAPSPPAAAPIDRAIATELPVATESPVATELPVATESPVVEAKAPAPRPAPHRHHHVLKRQAGCGPGRCPPAGSRFPAPRAATAAPARPGSPHVRSGPGR